MRAMKLQQRHIEFVFSLFNLPCNRTPKAYIFISRPSRRTKRRPVQRHLLRRIDYVGAFKVALLCIRLWLRLLSTLHVSDHFT